VSLPDPPHVAAEGRTWSLVLGGSLLRLGLGLATGILIVRALLPAGYAGYAVASTIMVVLGLLVDFGITGSAVARIARAVSGPSGASPTAGVLARQFAAARIGVAVLAVGVVVLIVPVLGGDRVGTDRSILAVAGIMFLASTGSSVVSALHQATSRFGTQTLVLTAHAAIALGLAAALAAVDRLSMSTTFVVVGAIPALIGAGIGIARLDPRVRSAWLRSPTAIAVDAGRGVRRFFGDGRWLGLHNIGEALLQRSDLLVLLAWVDPVTLGLYGVAVSVVTKIDIVMYWSVFNTLLPRASTLTPAELRPFLRRTMRRNAWIALTVVGGALAAPALVPLVYGDAYAPAVTYLRLLLGVAVIDLFLAPVTLLAFPLRRLEWLAMSAGLRASTCLAVALVAVPEHGVMGAIAARYASRVVGAAIVLPLMWRASSRAIRTVEAGAPR
jgi:O-antigen/teichoic acid export membrane protein